MCNEIAVVPTISPRWGWCDRRDLERALAEVCGCVGIGGGQCLCGLEQRRDRYLVTDLGACGELHRNLDRQGACFEQDNRRLAVEGAAGGHGHAGAYRLACEVVPERELLVALDEQVRLEQLADRRE